MTRNRVELTATAQIWPLAQPFVIARGTKSAAHVIVARISDGSVSGVGECLPYARYGETVDGVIAQITGFSREHHAGFDHATLRDVLPPGAARNAIDCALWDWRAKRAGCRAFTLAGLPEPEAVTTCFTLSLGSPAEMARAALAHAHRPLLKLKLGGEGDPERMAAVRAAVPHARLVADANESWRPDQLAPFLTAARACGLELIEQPLPADGDEALDHLPHLVPICADESIHGLCDLAGIARRYDAVNIKLDKTGGLTEALEVARGARAHRLKIMVGCMVATSLAMAPAMLLAQDADWVDLDGPLLLAHDRPHGLRFDGSLIEPPSPLLWG